MEAMKGLDIKSRPKPLICKTGRGDQSPNGWSLWIKPSLRSTICVRDGAEGGSEAGANLVGSSASPSSALLGPTGAPFSSGGSKAATSSEQSAGPRGGGARGRRGPARPFAPRAVVSESGRSREPHQLTRHGGARCWHRSASSLTRPERRTLRRGKSAPALLSSVPGPPQPPPPQPASLVHPYSASLAPRKLSRGGPWPQPRVVPWRLGGDGPGDLGTGSRSYLRGRGLVPAPKP